MLKTTVYLTEALKKGLADEARRTGSSEAEVIRRAIKNAISSPRSNAGFLDAEPIADRVDELLEDFGTR